MCRTSRPKPSLWVTVVLMSGFFERHPWDQGRRIRGIIHLAQFPAGRVRQDLPPLSQRPSRYPLAEADAQRDILPALRHRFRGRRGASVPSCPTTTATYSPGPPTSTTTTGMTPGGPSKPWRSASCPINDQAKILGRERPSALQHRTAQENNPREGNRDPPPGLVAG